MKLLLYVLISSTALVHAQDCRIVGQVFYADVLDLAIKIKVDSGDLVNFNYDNTTSFVREATRVPTAYCPSNSTMATAFVFGRENLLLSPSFHGRKSTSSRRRNLRRGKRTAFTELSPDWTGRRE